MLAGINTLVVAVVDGRGRYRIERQATFVALPSAQRPPPPAGVKGIKKVPSPTDAVLDFSALPPALRSGLAAAIGRPGLAAPRLPRAGKKLQPAGPLGPWVGASKTQRTKEIEAERSRAVASLQVSRKTVQELRDVFVDRKLRPADAREAK